MRERMNKTEAGRLGIGGRSCLHAEIGQTTIPKTCIHDFECWHCAFDQWIAEIEEKKPVAEGSGMVAEFLAMAA